MRTDTIELLRKEMKPKSYYTQKEVMNILCPTQSTTAQYLLNDAIACGILEECAPVPINKHIRIFRINQ